MKLSDFDFGLPEDLIAQTPAPKRDQSRLMIVDRISKTIRTDTFSQISNYLKPETVLALNNTRVFPAKLFGKKDGSSKLTEILLVKEIKPNIWEALIKGLAKIKVGTRLTVIDNSLSILL